MIAGAQIVQLNDRRDGCRRYHDERRRGEQNTDRPGRHGATFVASVAAHLRCSTVGIAIAATLLSGCRAAGVTSMPASPLTATRTASGGKHAAEPDWISIGPRLVGGWSGKVNAFAYDPSNPKVMYLGGGWGNTPRESPSEMGIYKTIDGGAHWFAIDDGLTNSDGTVSSTVNGLWLDPAKPSVVLAATEFGGTFRSVDGGRTWYNVDASESTRFARIGSTLYLASRRGVLESSDDGATWTTSLPLANGATTVTAPSYALYAGGTNGNVYRFAGGTWERLGHPGTGAIHDVAVDPFDANVIYANVDDTGIWNQNLYASIDGGKTWARIYCYCAVGAQAIAFSRVVPHRLYLGQDSGYFDYLTGDGNPQPKLHRATQPFGSDTRYIIPVPGRSHNDDACFILQDQGLAYAPSCSSGRAPRLSAIPDTLAYSFALTPHGSGLVALQDNGAGSSSNSGRSWKALLDTDEGGEAVVDPYDPKRCYFAHPDQGLYVSTDGCVTFTKGRAQGIESLAFDPARSNALYAITHADKPTARVSRSRDGGMTWRALPWPFAQPYQVAIATRDASSMLVAAGDARSAPQLYYSHDGGRRWRKSNGLPPAPAVRTIYFPAHRLFAAFDPRRLGRIVVADHDPVTDNVIIYRSTDDGVSFTEVSELVEPPTQRPWPDVSLPNPDSEEKASYYATRFYANRLAFNPDTNSGTTPALVLTTRFGAFISYDIGSTWRRIDDNAIAHHFIGVAWEDGYVYLASFGEGVIESSRRMQSLTP